MDREINEGYICDTVGDKEYLIFYIGTFGHNKVGPAWFSRTGAYKSYRFDNWPDCPCYSIDDTGINDGTTPLKI